MEKELKKVKLNDLNEEEDLQRYLNNSNNSFKVLERRKCPYLDTIDRQLLDFDMEKVCSVTLSNLNIYSCLVCGKFFQGRGQNTPAFTHSVQYGHFVFINLHNCKTYCLPDGYEIIDSSLDDVKRCLNPTFTREEIIALNNSSTLARDVHGVTYLPGFIGLNNLSHTDYINVTLHALSHIKPLREFFLDPIRYSTSKSVIVHKFGGVMRKIWSKHNFKSVVSPQEFIQTVIVESKKKFTIGTQAEAIEFMVWLLNQLHIGLGGTRKANSSVIYEAFQGQIEVTSLTRKKIVLKSSEQSSSSAISDHNNSAGTIESKHNLNHNDGEDGESTTKKNSSKNVSIVDTLHEDEDSGVRMEERWIQEQNITPFLFLTLDIPPTPLFKDSAGGLIIPQIPLFEVLRKLDGETWTDNVQQGSVGLVRKKYRLKHLPRYLILHLARFTKNNFYTEKNPTIVTFPVKNLELRDFLLPEDIPVSSSNSESNSNQPNEPFSEELLNPDNVSNLKVSQLKEIIRRYGNRIEIKSAVTVVEKSQLEEICRICLIRHQHHLLDQNESNNNNNSDSNSMEHEDDYVTINTNLMLSTKYDLVANICHDSSLTSGISILSSDNQLNTKASAANTNILQNGVYRIHVQNKSTSQWFEIQDLHVMETMPQMIGLSESYILIYEKKPLNSSNKSHPLHR